MRLQPSFHRVATQYLLGSDPDIRPLYASFASATKRFREEIQSLESRGYSGDSRKYPSYKASHLWVGVINQGLPYVKAILRYKVAPKGRAKKLEMAARVIMSARRNPRNYIKWLDKNLRHLNVLLEANTWEDKSENTSLLFKLGPFSIHNTLSLSGEELEGVTDSFNKAIRAIKRTNVRGLSKVLYGDVFVVGRLSKKNTLAWYNIPEDTVYVRPYNKGGLTELHNLIHELGHRYLERFASRDDKMKWIKWHNNMRYLDGPSPEIHIPAVGEVVEIARAEGRGRNRKKPVVERIVGDKIYVESGGFFTKRQFYQHAAQQAQLAKYPTRYSATSWEEHFCEALALRALGKLKEPHLSKFEAIWG